MLRLKEGLTYGCLTSGLNITEAAVNDYIQKNMQSQIINWIKNESAFSIPASITGSVDMMLYLSPCSCNLLEKYYSSFASLIASASGDQDTKLPEELGKLRVTGVSALPSVIRLLGGNDRVGGIKFYAADFNGKEMLLSYLDEWNDLCERGETYSYSADGMNYTVTLGEKNKITYTDRVGLLMGMMQTMLNVITYVLVAFTAISLVVSSVMIGIITYVSVVERVKEIGVLRSLGARKRDIRNLFNSETFIIGLAAGLIGIVFTYLISIVINLIIFTLTGIANIAALPPLTAFIMVCVSILLTLISGLIPAQAAAKKDPVIALRTE